ncbi:MAG TPA: LD-carboxypeptidase [Thermoanaerobaculia bacterium]|nr:LD-carboxypeptidase [Thermoanaerobaculia bacterium]
MINRRSFARFAAAAGLAGAAAPFITEASTRATSRELPLIRPRALREGDTVGLVLPASMEFDTHEIEMAREQLEALGFQVRVGQNAVNRHGYFAGTDRERSADVNAMFADPAIDGIFCYTGGWGTPRILPFLDYEMIRRNPKVIIGFSDITALINVIHQRTGLVTFHGPVASTNFEPYSLANMRRVIMSSEPIGTLTNPPKRETELVQRRYRTWTLRGGTASGRVVGGNLTLMAALMGTPYEIDTSNAILFLEDVREAIYRVDRMLTQLAQGGSFERIAGVAFGFCSDCPAERASFSLEQVLEDHFGRLGVPVFAGLAFGHIEQKLTLPIGMNCTIDADAGTVTIAEAAVVAPVTSRI